ncbi:inner-membrane translocator [Mesorhizobium loti]|nr:inner-membrane translocator [Mesorhizobium loti]
MVMSAAERTLEMVQRPAEEKQARPGIDWRGRALDRAPFLVACLMLALIIGIYGSLQSGVFTLDELNLDTAAAMTLMLAATGQTIVLLRGGIDLSIGGMISLGTVIAATRFTDDPSTTAFWALIILALGFLIGALNGLLISLLKLQPFLVTLATWSILNGVAMIILPTDGGSVPGW